jgi:hypothetical protein
MNITYDRYELFALFENEKVIDAGAEVFEYSLYDDDFVFTLYFSPYENFVSLTSKYKNWVDPVYKISMNDISEIRLTKEAYLHFYRHTSIDPVFVVGVGGIISLEYSI